MMLTSALEKLIQPTGPMNMDLTHIRMLYEVLMIGGFRNTLEIGSYDGASAIAFVGAVNSNRIGAVDFCDLEFKPRFHQIIAECYYPGAIKVIQAPSTQVIDFYHDFVFVDGDHSLQNVEGEVELLLKHSVPHIAAHDTRSSQVGIPNCEGAEYLRNRLARSGYTILEDHATRPGEHTERGFMFATKNNALAKSIQQAVFKLA